MISGIHYNFSLPIKFWKIKKKEEKNKRKKINKGYLNLIRNYYKYGWIIVFLFGASPAIHSSFYKNKKIKKLKFKKKKNFIYFPWATSLRISSLGHNNKAIKETKITFNSLKSYLLSIKNALNTPAKKFLKIKKNQVNTNILQKINELYIQIRPKRSTKKKESQYKSLKEKGIEYVEIRSIDTNPFSALGIKKKQILFLDLFLTWCALKKSKNMKNKDLLFHCKNWESIALEGRKPNKKIFTSKKKKAPIYSIAKKVIKNLKKIAAILDQKSEKKKYGNVCKEMLNCFKNPKLTISYKILKIFLKKGIKKYGIHIAKKNKKKITKKKFKILSLKKFLKEKKSSQIC